MTEKDLQRRMDLDGDGVERPTDCDDDDPETGGPEGSAFAFYADGDGDGVGGAAVVYACTQPEGFVRTTGDCNDGDASVTALTWYADADADGYGDANAPTVSCAAPDGDVADDTDCDDTRADVSPAARDYCGDGVDGDCNGVVDDLRWFQDADDDNFGDAVTPEVGCDPPDGFVADAADCDDTNPDIHPGANEVCDTGGDGTSCGGSGCDEDCNGLANDDDPGVTGRTASYADADGDGYGAGVPTLSCEVGVTDGTDCDDTDPGINPGVAETWYDGVDEDCDGGDDDDADADGYADLDHGGDDCDDTDGLVHPDAGEACGDATDNDCDGVVGGACRLSGALPVESADASFTGFTLNVGTSPPITDVGDLDGDGLHEVVFGAWVENSAWVLSPPFAGVVDVPTAGQLHTGCSADDQAGTAAAAAGDVDGDGDADWVLTAPAEGYSEGAAYVLDESSPSACGGVALTGDTTWQVLGETLAAGSDATGDGVPDLALGTDNGVLLVPGPVGASAPARDLASLQVLARTTGDALYARALVDLDGDGTAEVVVADYSDDQGAHGAGAVFVMDGTATGSATTADARSEMDGVRRDDHLSGAAPAGDVDGDGLADVLIAAPYWGADDAGAAFLFTAVPPGTFTEANAAAEFDGSVISGGVGAGIATAGDVNGDGRTDVLVDNPADSTGAGGGGAACLYFGPATGAHDLADADARIYDSTYIGLFGAALTSVGDANGDGFDDLIAGGRYLSLSTEADGYLFLGGP